MNQTSRTHWLAVIISLALITTLSLEGFSITTHAKRKRQHAGGSKRVLWHDPGNISQRDLYYGPGSKELAPKPPFRFVKEVKEGGMPKFDVVDSRGVKWRVKLGPEAQAETVSTRLVWAMGYNAEESYYFDRAQVDGLRRLSRGQQFVQGDSVRGARFEPHRDNVKRGKNWDWSKNPFKNTRELNGLKTLMVLLNNWDVFKKNNRVIHVKDAAGNKIEEQYTVTDLGATLGSAGGFGGRRRTKSNLKDFQKYRMVRKIENGNVKFDYNIRPKGLGLLTFLYPPYFFRQRRANNAVAKVPINDASWIGSQLAQLSDDQLRDSFRAAGYDRATTEGYVRTLRHRINELNQLKQSDLARGRRDR